MLDAHYPLQALLYSVALHRYLRWRQPGYDPEQHLGGVLYLFVRGMCGPDTPVVDGVPCGVFGWRPPAALVVELSACWTGGRDRDAPTGAPTAGRSTPATCGSPARPTGLLRAFNAAGVLAAADVHVAQRLGRLGGEPDEPVLLALALAVRGVRHGSVCVDLADGQPHRARRGRRAASTSPALPLAGAGRLARGRAAASPLVAAAPTRRRPAAAAGRRPALPRPLLAAGGAGPPRAGRRAAAGPPRRST